MAVDVDSVVSAPVALPATSPLVRRANWKMRAWRVVRRWPPFRQAFSYWNLLFAGPMYFLTLRTACQLDLFGLLIRRPGLKLPQIASEAGIQEYPARVLLLTCVSVGMLVKRGERYYCGWIMKRLFNPAREQSLKAYVEWFYQINYLSMFHHTEAIKECRAAGLEEIEGTEDNLYARLAHNPRLEETFHKVMSSFSHLGNRALAERVRFAEFTPILDVGGGDGENLATIARAQPGITGTLLDFPTVAERARQRFAADGLDHCLSTIGKNFLAEEFPQGFGCVLMAHLTPIFSEATNRELLSKAFVALKPSGMLCIFAPFMDDDETGPMTSAMLSTYFLCTVNGQGRHYSMKETRRWIEDAGFVQIEQCILTAMDSVLIARKP
jgi:hypothetical protein